MDSQQFIGPISKLIKTEIDKNPEERCKWEDRFRWYLETENHINPPPGSDAKCARVSTFRCVDQKCEEHTLRTIRMQQNIGT